ncbi:hypothetical protein FACS189413_04350 [Bacteroidia bacterium]|nr:hypothetical protein FACS189413_04350 [Bacteroidia bacterium]
MIKYLFGFLKYLFCRNVSLLALVDRYSTISRTARIYRHAKIFRSSIGSYSYVGKGTSIVCADMGKFCSIAGSSLIGMGRHSMSYISTSSLFTAKKNGTGSSWTKGMHFEEYQKITIGNDVWIGTRVIVMGGVTIGDGVVIGAGAIITKNVPPYAVVAGVPSKIIKYRFPSEITEKLLELQWWNFPVKYLKKNITLFQSDDISIETIERLKQKTI